MKRCINLVDINNLTYSTNSTEFVIHIPKEYDYRLTSEDRNDFIWRLLYYRAKLIDQPVVFYLVDDIDLKQFTKHDKKSNSN